MPDQAPNDDISSQRATTRRGKRLSPIWIVPLVAVLIGLWLVYDNYVSRGPQITLIMDNAEGIEAGSTLIKTRNVEIGRIESVTLSEDLSHIEASATMNQGTADVLVEDTRFWVVKPRIGREGISGLNTVLSGAYIQLQPGTSDESRSRFDVLEQPPVAPPDANGMRIQLSSDLSNSFKAGDPVTYQGLTVGRVEEANFDTDTRQMEYRLYIDKPYDKLITDSTRFWTASGVDLTLDSEGFRVSVESIETLISGGITFGIPEDVSPGEPVQPGTTFSLYADEESASQGTFNNYLEYVLLIDDTVRGLSKGAPVEFRGVRVGTVASVPWHFSAPRPESQAGFAIPVLIRIEPQRLGSDFTSKDIENWRSRFKGWFENGLRASLKTGNLLTGALYVDLNFQKKTDDAFVAKTFEQVPVFPSTSAGLAQIESKVSNLLDKLNGLDIEPLLAALEQNLDTSQATLKEFRDVADSTRQLIDSPATRNLSANLNETLAQFESLLRDLQPVARTLKEKPNALIFDRNEGPDPLPRAPN
ncbi:intermembrane transport protein PqiB [Pistricoccus aurantiacus]|uniref:Intermembrane transport protein PqiB n=1 Tax=Pistricoccus aurantiacus TaxID=1883414 RepID=A0A5B8SRG6_9GAMM|nr:intermembrane transport protein PqiB [Pistricoccus aurantiacus]QEA39769.1 intermembrane transport protein PqiB [Pistricoccus aurantiacus]